MSEPPHLPPWERGSVADGPLGYSDSGWGAGSPLENGGPAMWHIYGHEEAPYAGFWRRFWGLHIDSVLVQLAMLIVNLVAFLFTLMVGSGFRTCERSVSEGFVFQRCGPSDRLLLGLGIANVIVNLFVWYRVIPRAMGRDGFTWGMRQMGLQIHSADTDTILGPGLALWRAILAGVFQVVPSVAATIVFIVASRRGELHDSMVATWIALVVVLWLLPSCWSLFDRRRQTLYDKAVGSVVVATHEVDWMAVAAWAFSFLVPIFPLAIGFGHAARSHERRVRGLRGADLASTALFIGYVQLIVVVVVVIVGITDGGTRGFAVAVRS